MLLKKQMELDPRPHDAGKKKSADHPKYLPSVQRTKRAGAWPLICGSKKNPFAHRLVKLLLPSSSLVERAWRRQKKANPAPRFVKGWKNGEIFIPTGAGFIRKRRVVVGLFWFSVVKTKKRVCWFNLVPAASRSRACPHPFIRRLVGAQRP